MSRSAGSEVCSAVAEGLTGGGGGATAGGLGGGLALHGTGPAMPDSFGGTAL